MTTYITIFCLIVLIVPAALGNIFAYPISKKAGLKISHYISHNLAYRLFSILKLYKGFNYWAYKESKVALPEHFILISNHQSLLDIPVYMRFMPEKELRFVAKQELSRHVPLVSEMLRCEQHCIISRKPGALDALDSLRKFAKRVVDKKQIPVIFPEGTRTRDGNVGFMHPKGFTLLAEETHLPVVVCAVDGGWKFRDLKKILMEMKNGCYRVKVMKVFDPPESKEECMQILDESKILIQNQIEKWRKLSFNNKY